MKDINIKNVDKTTQIYLGEFLREIRQKAGWTREEFASRCEEKEFSISADTIKSYENGKRIPPLSKLICLFYILHCSDSTSKNGENKNILKFKDVCQEILNSIEK